MPLRNIWQTDTTIPCNCSLLDRQRRKVFEREDRSYANCRSKIEGGVRVCGNAVLGYFWCGVAAIFILKYGIAVFRAQTVCGKFKFHVPVVDEISLCRGDLLLFHDKRIQILKGLPG